MTADVQRCPYYIDSVCRCDLLRGHKGMHHCEHDRHRPAAGPEEAKP